MTRSDFQNSRQLYLQLILSLAFKDQTPVVIKDEWKALIALHHQLMEESPSYKATFKKIESAANFKKGGSLSGMFYQASVEGNRFVANFCDAILYCQSMYYYWNKPRLESKLWKNAERHYKPLAVLDKATP